MSDIMECLKLKQKGIIDKINDYENQIRDLIENKKSVQISMEKIKFHGLTHEEYLDSLNNTILMQDDFYITVKNYRLYIEHHIGHITLLYSDSIHEGVYSSHSEIHYPSRQLKCIIRPVPKKYTDLFTRMRMACNACKIKNVGIDDVS